MTLLRKKGRVNVGADPETRPSRWAPTETNRDAPSETKKREESATIGRCSHPSCTQEARVISPREGCYRLRLGLTQWTGRGWVFRPVWPVNGQGMMEVFVHYDCFDEVAESANPRLCGLCGDALQATDDIKGTIVEVAYGALGATGLFTRESSEFVHWACADSEWGPALWGQVKGAGYATCETQG